MDYVVVLRSRLAAAEQKVAELERECERLKANWYRDTQQIIELDSRLTAAEQELAAAKADAERYRFLRDGTTDWEPFASISGELLDQKIDASRQRDAHD